MDPVPLIPKSNQVENHDISHVIREVFQDIIPIPKFSKNVAENVQKYDVKNQYLKANSAKTIAAYDDTKLNVEDIGLAEDSMMIGQADFLHEQDVIDKNFVLREGIKLKRREVFLNLELNNVHKYGLLQKMDLLPNKPEKSMDFRINSNRHLCPLSCPNELDIYPTKLEKNDRKRKRILRDLKEEQREVVFKAEPDVIIFEDYKTCIVFEKQFKLRNITRSTQAFMPRILPKTSFFQVELQSGSMRVAPGMCVIFSVKYVTDIYQDVEEIMTFNTYTGRDVQITLISCRKPPNLIAFVFKTFEHFAQKCTPAAGLDLNDNGRAVALNYTIDCGGCLLGKQLNLSLILKNEGSIGRFFILNEDDWYFADITVVNTGMELMTRAFHIYPTYFEIDRNEFVELNITFFPPEFGLQVEKLFLLCNNNTLEEVEIIGDGVLFETNNIIIEAQSKHLNMNNMDAESNYFIDCGKCIPYQRQSCIITIHNNSIIDLHHEWKMRESVCHMYGTKLKKMDPSWITIVDQTLDMLPAQSTSDFELLLECKTKEPGLYSLVFTLYILGIPEASFTEDKTFYVREEPENSERDHSGSKFVDVIIGEVELVCEVTAVHLIFDPENIIVPYTMSYEEMFKQKLQIRTHGTTALDCEWKTPSSKCIAVWPTKFVLHPHTIFICRVIIYITTYEDIQETLTLMINDGLCEQIYNVVAKIIKPAARFSESLLNFGYIAKGKTVNGKELYVVNLGQDMVRWEIFEFYFDHEHNTICETDVTKHVDLTNGALDKNGQCKITYTIDKTDRHHRWLSFLILLSSHPTLEAMNSLCLITYEVAQPEIIIHTRSSQQPILYPGKLLYLHCTTAYTVCLHNVGTKLPGSFIWGKPVGKQAEFMVIECFPKSGIIQPEKCIHITITLVPQEAGIIDDIYIPCFVGNMDEPIMLTVLCVVDSIRLNFHIPDNQDEFQKVFWPPHILTDSEEFALDLDHLETEEEENNITTNSDLYDKLGILLSTYRSSIQQQASPDYTAPTENFQSTSNVDEANESFELHLNIESSHSLSSSEETTESNSGWTPSHASTPLALKNCFGSDLILQDHYMEYHNIPLRTPVKRTIIIENLTPVSGNFNVEATNFFELKDDRERDVMEDILVKLKVKKKDEWEESIADDLGIVVKTVPAQGTLGPYNSVEIDIWVYANTWGTYVEEILIEINEIVPYCFTVLIQVVGIPIEFPIALNTINKEPLLRFGNIPYLSKPFQRKLKITNFGSIPLCLVWHVFILKDKPSRKKIENDPFNVVVDTFRSLTKELDNENISDTTLELMLARYYGQEDSTIFEIEPREININSKSTEILTLTVHSSHIKPQFTETVIEAYLIGFVHLTDEFISRTNVYSRQTGVDVMPATVKIVATLELPLLKMELVKGDTRIRLYANDIIDMQEIKCRRVLVFRNVHTAPATIYMHTTAPFHIISLKTAQTNCNRNTNAAVVQPGDCVEVVVECTVDAEEVLQYSDALFNEKTSVFAEIPDFKYHSITLLRYLNIHQHGLRKQITPLELVIFYPELIVSHDVIDFGVVFVGNTKKMLLTLTNPTGSHVPYKIHNPTTSSAIIVKPNMGIIPKANGSTASNVIISLYFIPNESKHFQENIRILTNIPFYNFNVNLTGRGSNNEKFHIKGI